jgi:hypothetical protein
MAPALLLCWQLLFSCRHIITTITTTATISSSSSSRLALVIAYLLLQWRCSCCPLL